MSVFHNLEPYHHDSYGKLRFIVKFPSFGSILPRIAAFGHLPKWQFSNLLLVLIIAVVIIVIMK